VKVAVSASAAKPTKRWDSDGGNLIIRFPDAQKPVLDLICGFPDASFVIFFRRTRENLGVLEGLLELIISEK